MTSSTSLRIAREADRDIEDILQYTLAGWGEEQRTAYDMLLWEAFRRIQTFPEIGKQVDESRPIFANTVSSITRFSIAASQPPSPSSA